MPFLVLLPPDLVGGMGDQLHAADGFLSVPIALLMWVLTVGCVAISVRKADRDIDERIVPLMGVMAAFIFAAQMFNFPVAGGTSGHLLGGVLAAVLLGPWIATLVMACVVAVQALVFQDGGLLAMGANIFNMGIIGTIGGYAVYRAIAGLLGGEARGRIPAAAIAGWVSVVLAAVAMSIQLVASGTTTIELVLTAMLGTHALIGIGEALITAAALGFITLTRPDLFRLRDPAGRASASTRDGAIASVGGGTGDRGAGATGGDTADGDAPATGRSRRSRLGWWVGGIGIAALVVIILAPLASQDPDGLERIAQDKGFLDSAQGPVFRLLPDYTIPGIDDPRITTIISGLVGLLIVVALLWGVGRLLARRRDRQAPRSRDEARPLGIDRYIPGTSRFHRADARIKFVVAVAAILALGLLPIGAFGALGVALIALVGASVWAGFGPMRLVRGSVIALPFLLIALPLLFTRPGDPVVTFVLGPISLTVTDQGLREVATIVLKSWLSVQVALLLAYTTPFPDLIDALRALRLPSVMVGIIGFMYRYLAVLTDEAGRMNRAKASRSAVVDGRGGGSLRWRASVTGSMVGSLFIRSYERSERIYAAMLARGFAGTLAHAEMAPVSGSAIGWAIGAIVVFLIYVAVAHLAGSTW